MSLKAECGPAAFILLALVAMPASATDALSEPSGPVVLTVAGNIGRTNRPAFDPLQDAFLNHHDIRFEKAARFDRAMLEALGMREATVNAPGWPKGYRFEGPALEDVLAAVDAKGESITVLALDGYSQEINKRDALERPWIVALKQDGRDLGIGGRGPTYVLYGVPEGENVTEEDEQRWPWAAFFIEVR